ncbi:CBL-interacting protein kinase 23 [Porphyridium purpureum]|uniref:non-specific serine/threonine protein kinase n=1 Tax=Porphyridium purpureum TaxID=35688 RepID=A0A5J4Z8F9_PORPP|nr:CBL-interacting protein kinase 23 [Porphyridium purpureum]|eukprot:POR5955..scf295_1
MAARVGKYLLFETLGEGAFGKVKLGVHEDTGEQVAVKCMDKADIKAQEMTMNVRREIAIMKAVKHKNIVNMLQVLSSSSKLYIVMELVTGGELFTKILNEGKLPEDLARSYFQSVVDGVDYCHSRGVYHRDLKPENLLIDERSGELKITDFGLSAMKGTATAEELELLHTQCGSPNYCAPEIITSAKKGYNGVMVDVWSCGIILFALLAGYLPFYDENTRNLYKMIQHDAVKYPKKFPSAAKDLCEKLLIKDPERRISLAEVKQHPWFVLNYKGDGVLKGGITPVGAPEVKREKPVPPPSAGGGGGGGGDDDGDSDEERQQREVLKAAVSKRQIENAEKNKAAENKTAAPKKPAGAKQAALAGRIEQVLARYMHIFEIDESGMLQRSNSFRQQGAAGSISRGKNIAAAAYMIMRQQLQNHNDGLAIDLNEVNDGTLKAFENLLNFLEKKKNQVGGKDWLTRIPPLSEDEADLLEAMCQILEPNDAEDNVQDIASPGPGSPNASGRVNGSAGDRSSYSSLTTANSSQPVTPAKKASSSLSAGSTSVAVKKESALKKILGVQGHSYESDLPPEKALREVGKILTLAGYQVMMKRGDATKMKVELDTGGGEMMIAQIVALKNNHGRSDVSFKHYSGKKDGKSLEDLFSMIVSRINA